MIKKLLAATILSMSSLVLFGQGTIAIYNTVATYNITTNTGTVSGNTSGNGNYIYALLMATYGGAAPADNPLAAAWTFSGTYATNYLSGGIRTTGNAGGFAQTGWPLGNNTGVYTLGTPEYYMLVGWSVNLATSWTQLTNQIVNGFSGLGYYGYSAVGYQVGGNPASTPTLAAVNLFGNPSGLSGGGLSSGFVLNQVNVSATPEPSTMALAALGGASLLLFRRRKV